MNENNGIPRDLKFDKEGRDKLISGVEQIAKAVKSTLGARGNTVVIESANHVKGLTVTKDGVTVAKNVELEDPIENIAARMVRQAAEKTVAEVGDGTTTSIVLAEALIKACDKYIKPDHDKRKVLDLVKLMSEDIIKEVRKGSKRMSKKKLRDVAVISTNNDKKIGSLISKTYDAVGKDGIVTVDNSDTEETYAEVTEGIKLDVGYASSIFVNDHKRDEVVYKDAVVLITDIEINNVLQIENVLKIVLQAGKKLVIIGPCSAQVVNALAANVVRKGYQFVVVNPPAFGFKQHELMDDIALVTGGVFYSQKTGDDLNHVTIDDLGVVSKIVVGRDNTVIVSDHGSQEELSERIQDLKKAYDNETKESYKKHIRSRIATLAGKVGVINVGGNTDIERKELYDRVDDAVNAIRSAIKDGVVVGGGVALVKGILDVREREGTKEGFAASLILSSAVEEPFVQILKNAGVPDNTIGKMVTELSLSNPNQGYDVKSMQWVDMFDKGIVDPLGVVISALRNAVSVATTIMSTNAIITLKRA